jgi:hypothetical protein
MYSGVTVHKKRGVLIIHSFIHVQGPGRIQGGRYSERPKKSVKQSSLQLHTKALHHPPLRNLFPTALLTRPTAAAGAAAAAAAAAGPG